MSKHTVLASLFTVLTLGFGADALAQTACQLPITPGPCRGSFAKWGFDTASNGCKKFIYGGCQGNANRFDSEAACRAACRPTPPPARAHCADARKVGPCRAAINRYFWNTSSGACELFSWGGCGANGNNFTSSVACTRACGSHAATNSR